MCGCQCNIHSHSLLIAFRDGERLSSLCTELNVRRANYSVRVIFEVASNAHAVFTVCASVVGELGGGAPAPAAAVCRRLNVFNSTALYAHAQSSPNQIVLRAMPRGMRVHIICNRILRTRTRTQSIIVGEHVPYSIAYVLVLLHCFRFRVIRFAMCTVWGALRPCTDRSKNNNVIKSS